MLFRSGQLQRGEISRKEVSRLMREGFNVCSAYTIEMTVQKPPRPPLEAPAASARPAFVGREAGLMRRSRVPAAAA